MTKTDWIKLAIALMDELTDAVNSVTPKAINDVERVMKRFKIYTVRGTVEIWEADRYEVENAMLTLGNARQVLSAERIESVTFMCIEKFEGPYDLPVATANPS
jgi:hypothetical protein